MRRLPLVLGLAMLMLAASATPVLAENGEREDRERGRAEGRGPPADVGAFQLQESARRALGEHVSFTYTEGGIQAFTGGNVTLFDIAVSAQTHDEDDDRAGARADGSRLRVRMPTFEFVAHDNPAAVARMKADGTMTVTFAEGTVLARGDDGRVTFERQGVSGTLRGDDVRVAERAVTTHDDLLVFLDAPRGQFDVHRADIGHAIAKRHVGAEGTFNQLDAEVEQDIVSYGNVTMTTVKAEKGNLTVMVEGHGFEGRVLVLNVDGRVVGAARADELAITLDNLTIPRASDLADILDPDNDGFTPEYYIVHDAIAAPDAFQLIVTVPHYSVHVLSVTTAIVLPPPSVTIGLVAGLALLVPAGFVLFRRK